MAWQLMQGELTIPRTKFAAVELPGKQIAVLGGKDAQSNRLKSVEVYNAETDEWTLN